MLEEESIGTVGIGAIGPKLGISIAFIYLNPPRLGKCVLGRKAYRKLRKDRLRGTANIHGFWVGASGPYASTFSADDYHLVQGDRKLDLVGRPAKATASHISGATDSKVHYFIFFEGELDFSDPVTIFFERGPGTYAAEYWLDTKYLR